MLRSPPRHSSGGDHRALTGPADLQRLQQVSFSSRFDNNSAGPVCPLDGHQAAWQSAPVGTRIDKELPSPQINARANGPTRSARCRVVRRWYRRGKSHILLALRSQQVKHPHRQHESAVTLGSAIATRVATSPVALDEVCSVSVCDIVWEESHPRIAASG